MIKKTVTYEDIEGNKRTEDFYFNLTKAELSEMASSEEGGFENYLKRIIETKDANKMIAIIKDIIAKSYGVRTDDGKFFRKSKELSEAFLGSDAYSEVFMDIAANPDKANEFMLGILPTSIREEVAKNLQNSQEVNA